MNSLGISEARGKIRAYQEFLDFLKFFDEYLEK
jgi:hypothetical protein